MPDHQLPTGKELQRLPWPAIVAFAARCARHVQPLFIEAAKKHNLDPRHAKSVDNAITLAAATAANPATSGDIFEALHGVRGAADDAAQAANDAYDVRAARAANAANDAADAAYVAAYADDDAQAAQAAYDAAAAAANAAAANAAHGGNAVIASIRATRRDFELLLAACKPKHKGGLGWDHSTPVPPEFFGPLWPWGEPEDWPVQEDPPENGVGLEIEFEVSAETTDEEIISRAKALARQANAAHRAHGGHGLKVDLIEIEGTTAVPVGARS